MGEPPRGLQIARVHVNRSRRHGCCRVHAERTQRAPDAARGTKRRRNPRVRSRRGVRHAQRRSVALAGIVGCRKNRHWSSRARRLRRSNDVLRPKPRGRPRRRSSMAAKTGAVAGRRAHQQARVSLRGLAHRCHLLRPQCEPFARTSSRSNPSPDSHCAFHPFAPFLTCAGARSGMFVLLLRLHASRYLQTRGARRRRLFLPARCEPFLHKSQPSGRASVLPMRVLVRFASHCASSCEQEW